MSYITLTESPSLTFTSATLSVIDLTSVDNVLYIEILSPAQKYTFNLGTSSSVLLEVRQLLTIDFVSITSFNTTEILDFDAPQYWIGA